MPLECENVPWSDSYLLGDPTIDKEHKQLFELTEKLYNCNDNSDEVSSVLKELIKYTRFHFAHEEQYMRSIDFNLLWGGEHKQLHRDIVEKLNDHIKEKDAASPKEFAQKLAVFVKNNIVEHILTEDKRMHHFKKETA